jgi:hypothetical protein
MQNSLMNLLFVIPAEAGIQKMLIKHMFISWIPACAGMTILFTSRCQFSHRPE